MALLHLRGHLFWECHHLGALPCTRNQVNFIARKKTKKLKGRGGRKAYPPIDPVTKWKMIELLVLLLHKMTKRLLRIILF